jgi:orotate phosphoribosyltransferase
VATTGGSTLQALATLRQAHPALKVPYVITLVDRQAGATEAFAAEGVAMLSLFTMAQLLEA